MKKHARPKRWRKKRKRNVQKYLRRVKLIALQEARERVKVARSHRPGIWIAKIRCISEPNRKLNSVWEGLALTLGDYVHRPFWDTLTRGQP